MDRPVTPRNEPNTMQPETLMPAQSREHMRHTRKAFEQVGKLKAPARPLFDRFFDRLLPALPDSERLDWGDEADWARLQQEPLRARWLLWSVVIVVILLLVWAALAEIDEVTHGDGKVVTSSQTKMMQAFDQGQVEEILVREGQVVEAGQVLLRIDKSRFMAELGAADAERISLMAKVARLQALSDGSTFVMPEEVLEHAPNIATQELEHYRSSLTEAEAQLSGLRQQLTQRQQELREVQAMHTQAVNSLNLAREELERTRPLEKTGAVSWADINRLELNVEKFNGDRKQAVERIGRAHAAIDEAQTKIREADLNKNNLWRRELLEAQGRLEQVSAGTGIGRDKVEKAEVRSTVKGTVNRLLVTTVGGVVSPGKDLVEIEPLGDELVIEAKVKPRDIAFLRPGLPARVKITAYDFSIYGGMDGTLDQILPNTVTDERGNSFYVIKVKTEKAGLGDDKPIIPGMVADVNVLTGKKTVLLYLLKPVLRAKANAMTEK